MPVFPRFQRRINDLPDWPNFRWNHAAVTAPLAAARYQQGRLSGQMEALGFQVREEAVLGTVTEEVVKSSEIGGDELDADQVRASVARQLGMDVRGLTPADPHVDRVVEMMLDATQQYDQPLTEERLSGWHAALFPTGRSGMHPTSMGTSRGDSVISGGLTPPASPMRQFLDWFGTDTTTEPVLKAAQAHLWFVIIRPFDDDGGRIARAITNMVLARSEKAPQPLYSMSAQIREERADYYRILEETQRGTLDITPWMQWFLACLTRAIEGAPTHLAGVIAKARYREKLRDAPLNERQRLVINMLLSGFEGKLTTSKWAALTKCSQDTALRDIQQLVEHRVLVRDGAGGRSTTYSLFHG